METYIQHFHEALGEVNRAVDLYDLVRDGFLVNMWSVSPRSERKIVISGLKLSRPYEPRQNTRGHARQQLGKSTLNGEKLKQRKF